MDGDAADPLLLGQRVVAILETGLRTATYKLATLMALIEHCIENLPGHPSDALQVPIPDLAHRVLEIYWHQIRPFDGHELRQSTQPRARILMATNKLREAASVRRTGGSVDIARIRAPAAYERAIDEITLCLARQPLHRLQKLPGSSTSDPFLYDDSFLNDHVARSTLRAHGDTIGLKPGVAHGLARLAGLLKPALEIMWVDDVRRMNKFLDAEVPDVAGHLFGRERAALAAVREPFKDAFGPHCFYCGTHLPPITRSTTSCRGRWWGSTDWPTWCWPALAVMATRAARCRLWRSSTGYLTGSVGHWSGSPPRLRGRHNTTGWWRRRAASTAGSRLGCRRGRGTSGASGWISVSRRGGRESSFSASVRLRRAALAAPVTRVTN